MSEPEQDEPQVTVIGLVTATASMEVTKAADVAEDLAVTDDG